MSVSKKIEREIAKLDRKEELKELMLKILEEESKGLHSFKAKYDELVKEYIVNNVVGVVDDGQDW